MMTWEQKILHFEQNLPGRTPLLRLPSFQEFPRTEIWAKIEGANPSGSSKDRPAHAILRAAIQNGEIGPDSILIESSSGNMAIALALYGKCLGLKLHCITDGRALRENLRLLETMGAEVHCIENTKSDCVVQERLNLLREKMRTNPHYYWTRQYSAISNPGGYETVIGEILSQVGQFDVLFVPVSTGGAAAGLTMAADKHCPEACIMMVDAVGSAATHLMEPSLRRIAGFGSTLESEFVNPDTGPVLFIDDFSAISACHALARRGFVCGGSSGATLAACHHYLANAYQAPKRVVLFFPDRGERYLSTLYCGQWLEENEMNVVEKSYELV